MTLTCGDDPRSIIPLARLHRSLADLGFQHWPYDLEEESLEKAVVIEEHTPRHD